MAREKSDSLGEDNLRAQKFRKELEKCEKEKTMRHILKDLPFCEWRFSIIIKSELCTSTIHICHQKCKNYKTSIKIIEKKVDNLGSTTSM